jgi:hypothetical protein
MNDNKPENKTSPLPNAMTFNEVYETLTHLYQRGADLLPHIHALCEADRARLLARVHADSPGGIGLTEGSLPVQPERRATDGAVGVMKIVRDADLLRGKEWHLTVTTDGVEEVIECGKHNLFRLWTVITSVLRIPVPRSLLRAFPAGSAFTGTGTPLRTPCPACGQGRPST